MSKAYGYIRVSTELQDYDNQKFGLLEYANKNNIPDVTFIEETISSRKKLEDRAIWKLVNETLNKGDTLLVGEVTRLGRSTFEAMDLLKILTKKKIKAHIIKNNIKINIDNENELVTQMQIFMFGLAGQIERDFISIRTKEALARKKAQGVKLGRQKGQQVKSKLDDKKTEIIKLLSKDVNISNIAKIIECGRTTLQHYVNTRKLRIEAEILKKQKSSI